VNDIAQIRFFSELKSVKETVVEHLTEILFF
jgi:hypothetical protein